ncbi:hypothetical protein [Methyloprofundus sp.]|uniref:hypothetical protein n=1 Tax=Methyloprofundus sp. TaxID=2020875 RepID=UPI003D0F9E96
MENQLWLMCAVSTGKRKMPKYRYFFIIVSLVSCVSPSNKFASKALQYGFDSMEINSDMFVHRIYFNQLVSVKTSSTTLHVYLDGDGTPWVRSKWIAKDPTARNSLILRLMHLDKTPSLLLGRPCYYGLNQGSNCENKYWASHRYSSEVVTSMAYVLNTWLEKNKYKELVFIGYSGGGVLAILMANKINITTKVVTIAANLDIRAWSEFHGYKTLKNSLNPAEEAVLYADIQQIHFAGGDDKVVPAFIIKKYAQSQKTQGILNFLEKGMCVAGKRNGQKYLILLINSSIFTVVLAYFLLISSLLLGKNILKNRSCTGVSIPVSQCFLLRCHL